MSEKPAPQTVQAAEPDPWLALRQYTSARIAQGRSGGSLPTAPMLAFQLAHAQARDAVHLAFDAKGIAESVAAMHETPPEVIRLHSAAPDRNIYLRRPDLGRRLDEPSRRQLTEWVGSHGASPIGFAFVIADGLSARAVHEHALPVFALAQRALRDVGLSIAPLILAEQARVALGDEVGQILGAQQVAVLIGERPGLSAADSLGIYLTYAPRVGRHDAERNCISNVRPVGGLNYAEAAHKLVWLALEARRRQLTGVSLKDESEHHSPLVGEAPGALPT